MYDYIKKAYEVNPVVGRMATQRDSLVWGIISRIPRTGSEHYVWVKVGGLGRPLPFHPLDLDYYKPNLGRRSKDIFEPRPDEKEPNDTD